MRALLCKELGSLDKLAVEDVPSPRPGAGEVVIDVKASSLNFPDALMVQGLYQVKPPLPFSPGMEVAGVVKELGAGVTNVKVGDSVVAVPGHGGFAEECVARAEGLTPIPEGMAPESAAAFVLTYCTSLHGLDSCAHLKSGEWLLVLGAAGGVGTAAIEIGKAMGARVIAAASSDDKLALCKELGADETINYTTEDLQKRVLALTGGAGADVVYDPVGGNLTESALRATAWRGRFLVIGFASGEIPKIKANLVLLKERSIVGVYFGDAVKRDPAGHLRNLKTLSAWFLEKRINPVISERVSLAQAPAALQRLVARQIKGKVVVLPEAP